MVLACLSRAQANVNVASLSTEQWLVLCECDGVSDLRHGNGGDCQPQCGQSAEVKEGKCDPLPRILKRRSRKYKLNCCAHQALSEASDLLACPTCTVRDTCATLCQKVLLQGFSLPTTLHPN